MTYNYFAIIHGSHWSKLWPRGTLIGASRLETTLYSLLRPCTPIYLNLLYYRLRLGTPLSSTAIVTSMATESRMYYKLI
jgi:hypothetical protein